MSAPNVGVKIAEQVSLSARRRGRNSRKACANYWLGRGSLSGTSRRCFLRRRKKQICRHSETGTQTLHHRHAQPLLQNLADPARRSKEWDHVRPREPVLVHKAPDQVGGARRSARPLALLIGGNQAGLRLKPGDDDAIELNRRRHCEEQSDEAIQPSRHPTIAGLLCCARNDDAT